MFLSLSGFLFEDNYRSQSISFEQFCTLAKSAGYGAVELRRTQVNPDTPANHRKELLSIVRNSGLVVTCLTARGLPDLGQQRDELLLSYTERHK